MKGIPIEVFALYALPRKIVVSDLGLHENRKELTQYRAILQLGQVIKACVAEDLRHGL